MIRALAIVLTTLAPISVAATPLQEALAACFQSMATGNADAFEGWKEAPYGEYGSVYIYEDSIVSVNHIREPQYCEISGNSDHDWTNAGTEVDDWTGEAIEAGHLVEYAIPDDLTKQSLGRILVACDVADEPIEVVIKLDTPTQGFVIAMQRGLLLGSGLFGPIACNES